eukprot:TRINITY_DN533_c0_g5_i1.p1 TRINITY_DN533_c0_g5~~TRINITY_DN533_c0_g5_i1.p1  ORF type:complete len:286 (+),score=36.73 TRINITY_DN533_c0_g5_i1:82-939(+)
MFRRLQRLRHDRIASQTREDQPFSSILPNGNLQTENSGSLHQRHPRQQLQSTRRNFPSGGLLPVLSASEAEALQSCESDSESKSSLESVGDADIASRGSADETEAPGNFDNRTAGRRSITRAFGLGMYRSPLAGGPRIHLSQNSDFGSRELHQNLDEERQNLDDELPFPLDDAEALQNSDYRSLPHGAWQRSITYEVGPLGIRPLWTGGPWIQDDSDSDSESHELPLILEDEELEEDSDDGRLPLNGLEWGEDDSGIATTVLSPSRTNTVGSQNSKSDSSWSAIL